MNANQNLEPVLPSNQWIGSTVRQLTGESQFGPLKEFAADVDVVRRARPIAYIRRADGAGGTGFLIAPDLLLTNWHVLHTSQEASTCTIWFNFNEGDAGKPERAGAECYTCNATGPGGFFYASPYKQEGADDDHLDFAIVRVSTPQPPGNKWGYVPVTESPSAPRNAALTIIQHPAHEPTYVGRGAGQLKGRSEYVLHYLTDTYYGSSGAPVFNQTWELVGLHHALFDFEGGEQLEDGSVAEGGKKANEGIFIGAILAHLKAKAQDLVLPAVQRDEKWNVIWP
jgi:V8-like Glu-specific endopeptidase